MKSILQKEKKCWACGGTTGLESHHVFFGSNRAASERSGFKVWLCPAHHRGTYGVHGKEGHMLDLRLKQWAQGQYEKKHSRQDFMNMIGRNYLD